MTTVLTQSITMKRLIFLILSILWVWPPATAQSVGSPIDSLRSLLRVDQPDTNRIQRLLALAHTYILKPGEQSSDLDTALILARQAYGLSRRINYGRGRALSFLTAGQAQRERGNSQLGKLFTQRAIGELTKRDRPEDQADAYIELANYYSLADADLTEKIRLYERVIPLLQQTSARKKLADALTYRGDLYLLRSNNAQSQHDLRQALSVYQSVGHQRLQGLYDLMGITATQTGDLEAGLSYGLTALKLARQYRDSTMLCTIYNRLGITYNRLHLIPEAQDCFSKSLLIAKRFADTTALIEVASNLITAYQSGNQDRQALSLLNSLTRQYSSSAKLQESAPIMALFLKTYTNLRRFAEAQQACDKLVAYSKKLRPDDSEQAYIYVRLVPFYLATQQYDRARQVLSMHKAYCERTGSTASLVKNHLGWFQLDSALANYSSAIRHYQQYHQLNESLVRVARSKQVKELDIQYKTYEKQLNIQQLTYKSELQQTQLGLQQAQLSTAQLTRNFTLAVALLLLLLLGLGFNRYRLKQRSHQLLAAKQIEINQKNKSLQQVLGEKDELLVQKEWMLKEIHHRVKNNLQIVAGLLYSQGVFLKDRAARSAVRESQNRVQAMALLHQKLYQSDRLASVPMADYIHEIVDYLISSFDQSGRIKPQLTVVPVELDVTLAVPLGLIINEAVTNSLKYGFPNEAEGVIAIRLQPTEAQRYHLRISDKGVGLPADFNPKRSRSLGMSLIRGLSKQIGADFSMTGEDGVTIDLRFRQDTLTTNLA